MHRRVIFLCIVVLFCVTSSGHAIRTGPFDPKQAIPLKGAEKEMREKMEGCEGVKEEECLLRRTLVAHTDYIYTQEHHH